MNNIFGTPPKVVRSVGDLKSVVADGKRFYRQEKIHIPDMGTVAVAPYDNHLIFRDVRRKGWTLFCSCGSPACVVGYDAYKQDASRQGALLVCMMHSGVATGVSGKHVDGSS